MWYCLLNLENLGNCLEIFCETATPNNSMINTFLEILEQFRITILLWLYLVNIYKPRPCIKLLLLNMDILHKYKELSMVLLIRIKNYKALTHRTIYLSSSIDRDAVRYCKR